MKFSNGIMLLYDHVTIDSLSRAPGIDNVRIYKFIECVFVDVYNISASIDLNIASVNLPRIHTHQTDVAVVNGIVPISYGKEFAIIFDDYDSHPYTGYPGISVWVFVVGRWK